MKTDVMNLLTIMENNTELDYCQGFLKHCEDCINWENCDEDIDNCIYKENCWYEMSYAVFTEGLLSWHYDEYADGEW